MARRNHRSSRSGQNSIIRYIAAGTLGILTLETKAISMIPKLPASPPLEG